ncbi:GMC family oxidoreductase [Aspergillus stella-maris]|uniref:GMC family oxidoreductase n=1 Tax=Aspergillus stella-maris TaxID=1810926 RepID=UPI003CCD5808
MATSSTLPSNADYIIIGADTAGLVVASRLSETPNMHVVLLEAGPIATDDPRVQDTAAYPSLAGSELDWDLRTVPQTGLNNRELTHPAGKVVGGSSAINGSAFLPPSPGGINAWAQLGNPQWTWDSLAPYLQKTYTLHPPPIRGSGFEATHQSASISPAMGPIQVVHGAPLDNAYTTLIQAWNEAFDILGYSYNEDFLAEKSRLGTHAYTAAIDPDNVTIETGTTVHRILLQASDETENVVATGVEAQVQVGDDSKTITVHASREVIRAAGAFNPPNIFKILGGITATSQPIIDLPGVGENMQNHIMAVFPASVKSSEATADLKPGIKALALARADLPDLPDSESGNGDDDARSTAIQSILQNPAEASAIYGLAILPDNIAILLIRLTFPFSRGSTHITASAATDPTANPRIDPRFLSDTRDMHLLTEHTQQLLDIINTSPSLRPFFQQCQIPTDKKALQTQLRGSMATLAHHTCGTAAMGPKDAGVVVDGDLKVYRTKNVRVVRHECVPFDSER